MIPVEQTLFTYPDGNCFAACVASILELPLEAVPHFQDDDWYEKWQEWLAERNLYFIYLGHEKSSGWRPKGLAIANVLCGDIRHAVVCLNGEMVWNPHPLRDQGVGDFEDWTVLAVLDPAKLMRL
ncbi:MAG TPA: hypothetical protein VE732_06640 [Nitrososphaera sp.]|jgi:hypothetical protein|nr:hypothetical protein [Nitrososphaera sp.]